jgi:dipeptidase E
VINTELQSLPEMEAILRDAALVYIPGGNTWLLNHRLHISKLIDYLRKKVNTGLPVVAFSAGTILCGPNILTSRDLNMVESPYFHGLNATPFNFSVHYPEDEVGRAVMDDWLSEYHIFHENPVILLADGACVQVERKKTVLVRGDAWILRKGGEKEKLTPGIPILK